MNKTTTGLMAAKRVAVAVATVCATLVAPAYATDDVKNLLDLMLKKGVISQQDYDQFMKDNADAAENKQFKEQRLDKDIAKANAFIQKNADAGKVSKSGLGLESADGQNSIKLIGRIHMDYRSFTSDATNSDHEQDKFDLRRARFGFEGKFLKDFDYKLFANFAATTSTAATIDEGYVGYTHTNGLKLRIGKFKMPFSLEQLTSSNNIDFIERSLGGQIEGELVPAKQLGAMVFGAPISGATYALALSQGNSQQNATYSNPDIIGRVSANLFELNGVKDQVAHIGLGYHTGKIGAGLTSGNIKSSNTEAREQSGFFGTTVAADAGADRTANGIELAYATGPFKLQGEHMRIKYDNVTSANVSYDTTYVQAVYNLTGESHSYSNSSGTFGFIKPKSKFTKNGGTGAWQVGLRLSKFDGSGNPLSSNKTAEADATTLGVTWFMNDYSRVMLNYIVTDFSTAVGTSTSAETKQQAIVLRGQVSF
jgi:phosphate-selective porin OprO/OprP